MSNATMAVIAVFIGLVIIRVSSQGRLNDLFSWVLPGGASDSGTGTPPPPPASSINPAILQMHGLM